MKDSLRILTGVALAACGAGLLTLAFPPYNLWPLIFCGLAPVIVAQHRVVPRRLSGLVYGIGVGGFFWGYFGAMFRGGPWWMQALPVFIALFAALLSAPDRILHARTGYRWFVLHGATVWVGSEAVRGALPGVGTWGFVAYALYHQPWLIQPVRFVSIFALDLLVMAVNYALGLAALSILDRRRRPDTETPPVNGRLARRWLVGVLAVGVAWIGCSVFQFAQGVSRPVSYVRVAAIQPAFRVQTGEGRTRLYDLTRDAAAQGAQLIVWPEGALPFDPQIEHTGELRSLAAETGAYLVIGYAVKTGAGARNEAVVLMPDGSFLGPFGKDHPVMWSGETSMTRGPYAAYDTTLGRLGMMICYDLDFIDTARKVARDGAQLIAIPSFDWPAIADKHYTHLVFRAVENGVAAIKADVAFDSAIIAPDGRIVAHVASPEATPAVLVADVPLWVK